jgi:tetratricopeptide (TPR) repeat protein
MTRLVGGACAASAALLAACAGGTGVAGPRAEAAALPQVTCGGAAPAATSFAVQAQIALNRTLVVRGPEAEPYFAGALEAARQGIAADSANPLHWHLAGQAQAGLGRTVEADAAWTRAVTLCPELAADVTPARQAAYLALFNEGMAAFGAADTATAVSAWTRASQVYAGAWDAQYNLGVLYAGLGDPAKAVTSYRAALAAAAASTDTAAAVRAGVAETRANAVAGLLNAAAQLFQADRFADAADVFRPLAQADRNHRDAWYNLSLALYKLGRWDELVPVAERVVELDPLNYNAHIVLFNAHKGIAERGGGAAERQARERALAVLQRAEALPARLDGIRVTNAAGRATFQAMLEGGEARPGTPLTLEVVFWGPDGRLGAAPVTAAAPAKGASVPISAAIDAPAAATGITYTVR